MRLAFRLPSIALMLCSAALQARAANSLPLPALVLDVRATELGLAFTETQINGDELIETPLEGWAVASRQDFTAVRFRVTRDLDWDLAALERLRGQPTATLPAPVLRLLESGQVPLLVESFDPRPTSAETADLVRALGVREAEILAVKLREPSTWQRRLHGWGLHNAADAVTMNKRSLGFAVLAALAVQAVYTYYAWPHLSETGVTPLEISRAIAPHALKAGASAYALNSGLEVAFSSLLRNPARYLLRHHFETRALSMRAGDLVRVRARQQFATGFRSRGKGLVLEEGEILKRSLRKLPPFRVHGKRL